MSSKWVVVDDTDTDIQYSGPWFADSSGRRDSLGNYGPAYRSTLHGSILNASLSYKFSGTQVRVYGSNNLRNDSGVLDPSWECFVDNISIGATEPFGAAENNWFFCKQETLLDGPHILTVNVTVRKSQTFWFDQIQYQPSSTVPLDGKAVLIDNLDPQLSTAYGDGWKSLGGSANMTQDTSAVFTFQFTGVSLSWYGFIPTELAHAAAFGTYSINNGTPSGFLLKGLPASARDTVYNQRFFQTDQLAQGQHEITVMFQGSRATTPLTLDYLIVQNGSTSVPTTNGTDPSTPLSGSSPSGQSNRKSSKSNVGAIVGGVVGGLALIGLLLVLLLRRRKRKRAQREKGPSSDFIPQPFTHTPASMSSFSPIYSYGAIKSVEPLSTASASIPPTVPSTANTTGHQMVASYPSRQPLNNDANGSGGSSSLSTFSRVVVHNDSGIRLPRNVELEMAREIPPIYTPD